MYTTTLAEYFLHILGTWGTVFGVSGNVFTTHCNSGWAVGLRNHPLLGTLNKLQHVYFTKGKGKKKGSAAHWLRTVDISTLQGNSRHATSVVKMRDGYEHLEDYIEDLVSTYHFTSIKFRTNVICMFVC